MRSIVNTTDSPGFSCLTADLNSPTDSTGVRLTA